MNIDLVNKIKSAYISFANENGIIISQAFKTPEELHQALIGFAINSLVRSGASVPQAFDKIMGEGAYARLAEESFAFCQSA